MNGGRWDYGANGGEKGASDEAIAVAKKIIPLKLKNDLMKAMAEIGTVIGCGSPTPEPEEKEEEEEDLGPQHEVKRIVVAGMPQTPNAMSSYFNY
jgi:hypothetical protein